MLLKLLKIMEAAVPWKSSHFDWWGLRVRVIWFPSKQEIVRSKSFPSDSILSEIFLTWLLWEGIYIYNIKILSEMIKVGNDCFLQTEFGPKASETNSQRRFLGKKDWYQSQFRSLSVVCTVANSSAQNSNLENNAWDNTFFGINLQKL